MIRTEIQAEFDLFFPPMVPSFTAEDNRANALRCAEEDVAAARREYVLRRKQLGSCNKDKSIFGKASRRTTLILLNKARAACNKAEAAQAALLSRH